MKRIKVIIKDKKFIPTIGKGPINMPIKITEDQYNMLTKIGFNVVKVEDVINKINKIERPESEIKINDDKIEIKVEDEENSSKLEITESEIKANVDNEEDEIKKYTKEELQEKVKADLKKILEDKEIEYKYNSTNAELIELILENQ